MSKNVLKLLPVFSLLFYVLSHNVYAKKSSEATTSEVIKEIEKTLLFDKESRSRVNVYKKDRAAKKADYVVKAGNSSRPQDKNEDKIIEIIVVDPKSGSFDLRKKEKLAYNAALIGQYEVAIELYKQVLAKDPNNEYSKFSLAVVYQQFGQLNKAKTIYRDLLKKGVKNEDEVIGNLLAILIEQTPKDASYLLSRLSVQSPKSSYILAQAAVVYDKLTKYDDAITLLERAINLEPKNIGYRYNLAIAYDKAEKYDSALNNYLDVVDFFKSGDEKIIALDQVKARIKAIKRTI
ncbi:MAG: tetratricopeptide repeat protein [Rickettsiales bacterium]|nr:tetratricopeptide repeat protein [Rickettsiales bacterium]